MSLRRSSLLTRKHVRATELCSALHGIPDWAVMTSRGVSDALRPSDPQARRSQGGHRCPRAPHWDTPFRCPKRDSDTAFRGRFRFVRFSVSFRERLRGLHGQTERRCRSARPARSIPASSRRDPYRWANFRPIGTNPIAVPGAPWHVGRRSARVINGASLDGRPLVVLGFVLSSFDRATSRGSVDRTDGAPRR
jgi:hypothetical protein